MDYTTLQQLIQDYTQNTETSFVANIPNFVQQTEQRLNTLVQIPYYQKSYTNTLTSGTYTTATPNDFLAPLYLAVISGTTQYPLLEKDISYMREVYPDTSVTGLPRYYSILDNSLFTLAPTPDQNYSFNLEYHYRPTSITVSGTSWIGDNMPDALLYGCLLEAYTYMKGDQDIMTLYQQRYDDAVGRAKVLGEGKDRSDQYRVGTLPKTPIT